VSVSVWAETKPWAATQKLEDITGLNLPKNYKKLAPWQSTFYVEDEELPEYYDWRVYAQGLTPVKRQKWNDCWAQGTVGVLESLVKIWHGVEIDASVQQVISCSGSGTAARGGYFAHEYHRRVGAVLATTYPYTATDTRCRTGLQATYQLEKWGYVGQSNRRPTTKEMKKAMMEHGPLGVTISANSALQNFTGSGVFKGCTNGGTNHIEVIVGWNDKEGGGVWFVRNSWGASHGDNGYAKIPYGCSRVGETTTWADLKL
jgi:C1A family cysteine protease